MDERLQTYLKSAAVRSQFRTLQAVSGRMRFPILNLLERVPEGLTVTDLARILAASPSRISHQLAILRRNGLIRAAKDGRNTVYSLSKSLPLRQLLAAI
jgi:DNA-binding transcriptional ArsR family regulator